MDAIRKIEKFLVVGYMAQNHRFKLSFNKRGGVYAMAPFHRELEGEWAALVPASDDSHIELHAAIREVLQTLASKEAELVRLREALDEIAATRASEHGTAPMMIARCMKIARAAITQPPKEPT